MLVVTVVHVELSLAEARVDVLVGDDGNDGLALV